MQLSQIETTALQKEQLFLCNIIHRGYWEWAMLILCRISSTKESAPIRSHQAHRIKSRCQIQGDLNINSLHCAQPDGVISRSKGLSPASLAAASQSRLKALQRQMWSCSGEQRRRGRRKQEGWDGEAVFSHGAGGSMGGKSHFWQKPPRVVIGAAWSFLAPQFVRKGQSSLCLAVQQEANTCCPAIPQSLNHLWRRATSKGEAGHQQISWSCLSAFTSGAVQ